MLKPPDGGKHPIVIKFSAALFGAREVDLAPRESRDLMEQSESEEAISNEANSALLIEQEQERRKLRRLQIMIVLNTVIVISITPV